MSEELPDAAGGGFDVVCVPIGDYQWHPSLDADTEAAHVADLFTALGGRAQRWAIPDGQPRTRTVVDGRLLTWAQPGRPRSSVLFWVGHGQANPDGAWLASHETPVVMEAGGVLPEHLAGFITAEWRRRAGDDDAWTIVVIEACGAERFVNLLQSVLLRGVQPPRRFVVIGVGADDGAGNLGEFRQALDAALATYHDGDDTIGLVDLLDQVEDRLLTGTVHRIKPHRLTRLLRPRLLETSMAASMSTYAELRDVAATLSPDERAHFLPKAQGADHLEYGDPPWYFVGRDAERRAIAAWLHVRRTGLLIVTGPPGSGKSALLGHVLVHASRQLRELLVRTGRLAPLSAGEFPDDLRFDAAIHLAGMDTGQAVRGVAAAAGLGEPPAGGTVSRDVEWLLSALSSRGRPLLILADALDEAHDPAPLAGAVLRRLAAVHGVRVVLGTRATATSPGRAAVDLLEALGAQDAAVLTVERDPAAIHEYVRLRLHAARAADLLAADDAAIDAFAAAVQQQGQEFLYARLAVHEAIQNPALLRWDDA
ncbi:ATP-binding protein [Dactylosporangium sp. NBC_01737]|uniref:ATP-binding protein n=1 Tax=Dactylosporangium sp. NBC_01737 TaxID=2975959 RepID=UPI002E101A15|nr:ATP-binding protein [Dactylosporangium sp. NBC_01737]